MKTHTLSRNYRHRVLPAVAVVVLQYGMAYGADATDATDAAAPSPEEAQLPPVIVVGKRASLMSAQEIKRNELDIVDSVVADDIGKLPDISVSDALQRVTGVQIERDRGEGTGVAIRGLTEMETTLNGREVFTAGSGRNLDFSDIPAEMVSSIKVYKTSSADHIEGGIGGLIDLRTRRPFDFRGREVVGSARLIHGDLVNRSQPQFSLLASDRWKTGSGEFGALVNFSHQKRAWREDQKGTGNPVALTDLIPGITVIAPNGTSETTSVGERERNTGAMVLQWRPAKELELYAEGNYTEFRTLQNSYQINVSASPSFVAGSPALFPGTNDLKSITWTNAPVSVLSFARDTVDRTAQAAVGGRWSRDAFTLKADISHTSSHNGLFFSGPFMSASAANFAQDLSTRVPGTSVSGTDLLNPANFQYTGIAYRTLPFDGSLTAAQLDGEYQFLNRFLDTLSAGVRYARRGAGNAPGLVFADAPVSGISAADKPGFAIANPYGDFFPGEDASSIGNFTAGNLATARDAESLRRAFGITTPIPAAGNPLGLWDIREETQAAYLMARFKGRQNWPLDGNAGVRVVRTHEVVSGAESVGGTNAVVPVNVNNRYTDYLPSLNLRYRIREGLYLRGAVSKTITRPDFNQLSPSLTLIRNSINPALNQGSAGNPELRPIRSDNLDLALEKYFNASTSVSVTGFTKRVDGFVTTVSSPEIHDGVTYQVSRPQNSQRAHIRGVELAYQQFFDFLPGWMSGLGMQANYTFIDSETPNDALGGNVPLQNLSRNSANLVGIYEKGRVSARIAYNWRDKFLSGITNIVGIGALPVYTKGYGWLDASLGYRVNDHLTLALEGTNLLRTIRTAYYGVETRPQSAWINDRQLSITATIHF